MSCRILCTDALLEGGFHGSELTGSVEEQILLQGKSRDDGDDRAEENSLGSDHLNWGETFGRQVNCQSQLNKRQLRQDRPFANAQAGGRFSFVFERLLCKSYQGESADGGDDKFTLLISRRFGIKVPSPSRLNDRCELRSRYVTFSISISPYRSTFAVTMLCACLIAATGCYSLQRQMLYAPSHEDEQCLGNETFKPLVSSQGSFLGYVREVTHPKKVLLYFHGNGGEALQRTWLTRVDPQRRLIIVLAEYPGFGGREGIATQETLFKSSLEIYDELDSRYELPITVMGESLGTGVASFVASKRPVASLALAAPFTSAVDVASEAFWFFPVRKMMKDRFDTMQSLEDVTVPLRIVHGTADTLIPIEHSRRLLEAYSGEDKQLYEIPEYSHNDLYQGIVTSTSAEEFRAFLQE